MTPIENQKVAHTAGPWSVAEYGDGDSLVIHAGEDWRVCFMATPGSSPRAMETIEANARLIAAAPDLLEALKEIERICGGASNFTGESVIAAKARAALAKAEGQP